MQEQQYQSSEWLLRVLCLLLVRDYQHLRSKLDQNLIAIYQCYPPTPLSFRTYRFGRSWPSPARPYLRKSLRYTSDMLAGEEWLCPIFHKHGIQLIYMGMSYIIVRVIPTRHPSYGCRLLATPENVRFDSDSTIYRLFFRVSHRVTNSVSTTHQAMT